MALVQAVVHDDQLDLHLFRQDVLDVDTHGLPGGKVGAAFGKTGQVGRDLNEGTVLLHAAHDAHHCFTHRKMGGVLGPGAQQFPDGEHKAALHVPVLDRAQNLLPHAHPVGGGGNAAHRHAVDGQQGTDAAPHIAERTKWLNVSYGAGQDIAGRKGIEIIGLAHPLRFCAGKPVEGLPVLVGVQSLHHKAGGAAHPRQHGNVPHGAVFGSVGALHKGHHGPDAAQVEPQLPLGVKGQGGGLQNLVAGHGGPQLCSGQPGGGTVIAFGTVCLHHLSFLFLC